MKYACILAVVVAVAGIVMFAAKRMHKLDGPDMVYRDSDYRSEYANLLDFDSYDGHPYFAAAFLGYGGTNEERKTQVMDFFVSLGAAEYDKIEHFDFEGDEWYLVIPRYRDEVVITDLETGEEHIVYNGTAFTVRCNMSDLHSNIEISTSSGLDAHSFSPGLDGKGELSKNNDVWDVTLYLPKEMSSPDVQ